MHPNSELSVVKFFHGLWILFKSGVVVFEYVEEEDFNPDLFGAMMAALNLYAGTFSEGGLSHFYINDFRIVLIEKSNMLFVCRSSKDVRTSQVKEELKNIANKFFKMFSEEFLLNWKGGDINIFSKFKKELKIITSS